MTTEGPELPEEGVSVPEDEDTGRPVRIWWMDSGLHVNLGWSKREDHMHDTTMVESVGLWLGQTDTMLFVANSRDRENDNWLGSQTIWRPSVKTIEFLDERTAVA